MIYIHTAMNVSVLFCSVLQASDRTFMITILIFLVISFTTRTAHTTQLLIRNENLNVKFHEIMFPIPCDKYHGKTFGQRNVWPKTYTIPHKRSKACSTSLQCKHDLTKFMLHVTFTELRNANNNVGKTFSYLKYVPNI